MNQTRRAALAGLALAPAAAATTATAQGAPPTLYLFRYDPGPAWVAGQPMHKQALRPHMTYISGLIGEGKVAAGGPYVGVDGGMAIVRAADAAEAEALLAKDPAITAGVFKATIQPWQPFLDSGKPLRG